MIEQHPNGDRAGRRLLGALVTGDLLAMVVWVVLGLASHSMSDNVLGNIARIAAPFLIGWGAAAALTRLYDPALIRRPAAFLGRSAACWLLAVAIGLFLRATLFGSGFVPVFAAVTVVVTGVLVLGWRSAFLLWTRVATARRAQTQGGP